MFGRGGAAWGVWAQALRLRPSAPARRKGCNKVFMSNLGESGAAGAFCPAVAKVKSHVRRTTLSGASGGSGSGRGPGLAGSRGQWPRGFALAGQDGTFHPAAVQSRPRGARRWAVAVAEPAAARQAWEPYPDANLVNADGPSASIFRVRVGP